MSDIWAPYQHDPTNKNQIVLILYEAENQFCDKLKSIWSIIQKGIVDLDPNVCIMGIDCKEEIPFLPNVKTWYPSIFLIPRVNQNGKGISIFNGVVIDNKVKCTFEYDINNPDDYVEWFKKNQTPITNHLVVINDSKNFAINKLIDQFQKTCNRVKAVFPKMSFTFANVDEIGKHIVTPNIPKGLDAFISPVPMIVYIEHDEWETALK